MKQCVYFKFKMTIKHRGTVFIGLNKLHLLLMNDARWLGAHVGRLHRCLHSFWLIGAQFRCSRLEHDVRSVTCKNSMHHSSMCSTAGSNAQRESLVALGSESYENDTFSYVSFGWEIRRWAFWFIIDAINTRHWILNDYIFIVFLQMFK